VISLFDYSEFRIFLKDWLQEQKALGHPMTYEAFGEAVGFTSKGFLTQILQGKTKVPTRMVNRIAEVLKLKKKEKRYFGLLVQFNQAKSAAKMAELHKRILSDFKVEAKSLAMDQFEYYQKWYYSAVRSLLGYYPFGGDFLALGAQLQPAISAAQAKRAVKLLEELGLIHKKDDGFYHLTDRLITSGESFLPHALIHFQRDTMDLAKEALENFPESKRSASTLTLGLSENGYQAMLEKLRILRQELTEIARFDKGIDRVIQVNLHAFPLTRLPKVGK
jgi:uncharacterized protein (TIGR02147 family)